MRAEVAEIDAKAKAARQPMLPVMERAKVAYSTWMRWKNDEMAPNLGKLDRVRSALDEIIAERST